MKLSLTDAARILGKSSRQVRYMIHKGRLPATKLGERWVIRREDLPVSAGQQRALERKKEKALNMAENVLHGETRPFYSVLDLKVFHTGSKIYHELIAEIGKEDPAGILGQCENIIRELKQNHKISHRASLCHS